MISRCRTIAALTFTLLPAAYAQQAFTPGNIVVTRSVYTGDQTTLSAGQPLPPVCPATAACGTGKATDSGVYPSNSTTNNVWNDDKVDGSFGVTSPIFLDQLTPSGSLVSTMAIPTNMVTTSFSSKSELAINLSDDGTALTFMAYVAPVNAIDVSDANTPGIYDPTNPAGGSYYRAVVQVNANGTIQVTPTNAYSGNNGRAVMLAGGNYYMAGNSNNGSGTPTNVIDATGVEMATPGQAATTVPTMIGSFAITQVNDPTTGLPLYTTADKAGKDNNFRGLTVFNNTLYVTKGSGSNGIDTVYQVGTAGTLPAAATAANTPITILPGFTTGLAKNATASSIYPFGIWFANATTLYVGDEGDGTAADAATAPNAGLQKWSLVNGTWQLDYVMQKGLSLGQPYSIANYPASLNTATDGLRNITGKINGDGTVTIWGVTSTVSGNGDQGADPNMVVMITDVLANTSPAVAANQSFTVVEKPLAGTVYRGVALAPTKPSTASNVPLVLSLANYGGQTIAPGSLVAANGQNLAPGYPGPIVGLLPFVFDGTSVSVTDSAGKTYPAQLFYVGPGEVDFVMPTGVASGAASVTINSANGSQTASNVVVATDSPGLFTLNSSGLAAAYGVSVSGNTQTPVSVYTQNSSGVISANPINVSNGAVYLTLYGSGIAGAGTANTTVTVNGTNVSVPYAGPSGTPGLDQVNIALPATLAGKGWVDIALTAGGVASNPVQIMIQ